MVGYLQKAPLTRFLTLNIVNLSLTFCGSIAFAEWTPPTDETAEYRLTIEEVFSPNDCDDSLLDAECDFYAQIRIQDEEDIVTGAFQDQNLINPNDWSWQSESYSVWDWGAPMIVIGIRDEDVLPPDEWLNISSEPLFETIRCDMFPRSGSYTSSSWLYPIENGIVKWNDWTLEGDFGTTYYSTNDTDPPPNQVDPGSYIKFRIDLIEPAYGPHVGVRCLHKPLWPQPGETVTIKAQALDGSIDPNGNPRERISDSIEIWVDDQTQPLKEVSFKSSTSVSIGPLASSDFSYNCRVEDDGQAASTGWRRVGVGSEIADEYDMTVPVYYNGSRKHALDIIFHPEKTDYQDNPGNEAFLDDVYDLIWNSLFTEKVLLQNQMYLNFWIAIDETIDLREDVDGYCTGEPGKRRAWSDENHVVHQFQCIDKQIIKSAGRFTTTKEGEHRTMLHESSHALFGLSDEYECNNCSTFYFYNTPFPNVYKSKSVCVKDAEDYPDYWGVGDCEKNALKLEREEEDCRSWLDSNDREWWTSDPNGDDIMVDKGRFQLLDVRRIEWQFCKCSKGDC